MEYLYVQNLGKESAMYLLDPSESILSLGLYEKNAEGLDDRTTNDRIEATVTKSEYGWLCTCAEPVHASDNSAPAIVCVDLDMNEVMSQRNRFMVIMVIQSVIVLLLMAFVGSFYIRKVISDPIFKLAQEASAFCGDDGADRRVV